MRSTVDGIRKRRWPGEHCLFFLTLVNILTMSRAFYFARPQSWSPSSAVTASNFHRAPFFLELRPSSAWCDPFLPFARGGPSRAGTVEAPPSPPPQPSRRPPRRTFEAWTWRGHRINYRVEGDAEVGGGGRMGMESMGWLYERCVLVAFSLGPPCLSAQASPTSFSLTALGFSTAPGTAQP